MRLGEIRAMTGLTSTGQNFLNIQQWSQQYRRVGRAAEGTGLLNRHSGNTIVSSNLTLSAKVLRSGSSIG
jgi:hypothetical protein